jgi:hypothetical protein
MPVRNGLPVLPGSILTIKLRRNENMKLTEALIEKSGLKIKIT